MQELIDIQNELKVPKSQTNAFGKYKYRSCEDILEAVKPIAAKHGCYVSLENSLREVGGRVYIESTAILKRVSNQEKKISERSVSSTAYARETKEKKGMDEAQITGAATSYANKYALCGLFAINDIKDPDSDVPEAEPVKTEELKKTASNIYLNEKQKAELTELSKVHKWKAEEVDVILKDKGIADSSRLIPQSKFVEVKQLLTKGE